MSFISGFYAQIKPNEKLVFSASYEMNGMMTTIAQVILQTENISTSKLTYLHLSAEACTFSKWDSYFKIRDYYESYVHPASLKPSMYKRNVLEGGYRKTEKYLFNSDGTINSFVKKNNKPERNSTFKVKNNTYDIVTLLYRLRTIDFSKYKNGQSLNILSVFDEKERVVTVKLLGKEFINNKVLGRKECYKLSISANTKKLKGIDKNLLWITTDSKHIPCMAKFNITVGNGQLILVNASGI